MNFILIFTLLSSISLSEGKVPSDKESYFDRQKIKNNQILTEQSNKFSEINLSQAKVWSDHKDNLKGSWTSFKKINSKNWETQKNEIKKMWNELRVPEIKIYVNYSVDLNTRLQIDYETGQISVESLSLNKITNDQIKKNIIKILGENDSLFENQLENLNIENLKISEGLILGKDDKVRNYYSTKIPMASDHLKIRARKFIPLVNEISSNFSIPKELIMAIIWQESAFNPLARSHIPAFGLMQIVPKYAGYEVREHLGEKDDINDEFLYNPENNIKYGINYLSLLSNKYFSHINPFTYRAPFVIAGYNWGPTRLLKHIERGKIKITNQSSIINQIQSVAPAETKDYLAKVFDKWDHIKKENWITN